MKIVKIEPQYTQSQKVSLVPFDVNVFIEQKIRFYLYGLLLHQKICLLIKVSLLFGFTKNSFILKNLLLRNSRRWSSSPMKSIF